jgi:hypothetical protein
MLPKLVAIGIGGGARLGQRREGRPDGEELLVGSDIEYECLLVEVAQSGFCGLGVDCAVSGAGRVADGDAKENVNCVVGGQSGLLGSSIGLEISLLSIEAREREERLLPLIDSVSLVHEKARLGLVLGVLLPGELRRVMWPTGTRSSTSLNERLNLATASSSSMVVQGGGYLTVVVL